MTALIGIDCATQPRKVGLALGFIHDGGVRITECCAGSVSDPPVSVVSRWLNQHESALIALDAPLGWAKPLGSALAGHEAGQPMGFQADDLFKRYTDVDIRYRFRKYPLEIGANLISRTAVAALKLLQDIREATHSDIPLARSPDRLAPVSAIEVYPAVTRLARNARDKGGSLEGLDACIKIECDESPLSPTADVIDAMACVLAAADFLEGRSVSPDNSDLARSEGWIWAPQGVGTV